MTTKLFKANSRRTADYDWLKANFSFSFANYFNPNRIQFGALRVLNDDTITGRNGFGEVQVMSAGIGIQHSEMNASQKDQAKTLQL